LVMGEGRIAEGKKRKLNLSYVNRGDGKFLRGIPDLSLQKRKAKNLLV